MKTPTQFALTAGAAALLTACMPVNNPAKNDGSSATAPLSIVITQPAAPDVVPQMIAALRRSLSAVAKASKGAVVPIPEIRILRDSGDLLSIPVEAPTGFGVKLFGEDTPSARQQKLEKQLNALNARLKAGCTGKGVAGKTIKEAPQNMFKTTGFAAWIAGGGASPWEKKDIAAPSSVIEDRAAFEHRLTAEAAQGGNFLIITDHTGVKPTAQEIEEQKSADTVKMETAKPSESTSVAAEDKGARSEAASPAPRDNIFIEIDPNGKQASTSAPNSTATVTLPKGAELIGKIGFAFKSDKLNAEAAAAVKRYAEIIKARGLTRVIIVASADYRGQMAITDWFSKQRATVVEAALLKEGIVVERRIEVGERLSLEGASEATLAQDREVQIYVLAERLTATEIHRRVVEKR